ncbi:arsenite S-adenosylmethyltransferase [Halobacteriales archaeon QS_4_66_20]|nr:MAG: arsenite S-adenosylmethyltransferase [Halobacteriales archaeon QS_4_66_20]
MSEESPETDDSEEIGAAEQRRLVRDRYGGIAGGSTTGCGGADDAASSCCSDDSDQGTAGSQAQAMGYAEDDVEAVEPGANLGLGCGNPTAIASLDPGETVLDLGSGAGFDCFLAAEEVGTAGQVIGVDMTPAMVEKARENVEKNDATNVAFRLGEIEHLPVADATVDVVISNCVVNLSPDKPQVFREAFRVLRPGGRLAIADVVKTAPFPETVRLDPDSVSGCVAGAARIAELESMLADAGFVDVVVEPKADSEAFIREWDDQRDLSDYIVSATIEARKPPQ